MTSIKTYSDRCVSNQKAFVDMQSTMEKEMDNCRNNILNMDDKNKTANMEIEKQVSMCEKYMRTCKECTASCRGHVSEAARLCSEAAVKDDDVIKAYDKVIFAATHAEDMFDSAMVVLSTAAELVAANNEVVHHMRDFVGHLQFPFKISANLGHINSNLSHFKNICRTKKSCVQNFSELSSVSKKVAAMENYLKDVNAHRKRCKDGVDSLENEDDEGAACSADEMRDVTERPRLKRRVSGNGDAQRSKTRVKMSNSRGVDGKEGSGNHEKVTEKEAINVTSTDVVHIDTTPESDAHSTSASVALNLNV